MMMVRPSSELLGAAVLPLLLAGCATPDKPYQPEQLIKIEHPAYTAELVRPETARFSMRNARFVEGGWLLSLTPRSLGRDIFHRDSVIPKHNARGLPVEYFHAIPLGDDRYLRCGVGIVSRENEKDRFHDRARERFPWFSEVVSDDTGTTVYFYQFAPRYYVYRRTVTFKNTSNQILFEDELQNLGSCPLRSRIFFHPFFKLPMDAEPWCRMDAEPDFANPVRPPLPGDGPSFFATAEVPDGKTWFVCGADLPMAALWVDGAREVGFWREKRADTHVFAVEPFVDIDVPSWERHSWTWGIAVP